MDLIYKVLRMSKIPLISIKSTIALFILLKSYFLCWMDFQHSCILL